VSPGVRVQVRDAVDIPVALIGGVTKLSAVEGAVREGFPLVQMARALIHKPSLPEEMRRALLAQGRRSADAGIATGKHAGTASRGAGGKGAGVRGGAGTREAAGGTCGAGGDVESACTHCNQCVVATLNPALGMVCAVRRQEEQQERTPRADQGARHAQDLSW